MEQCGVPHTCCVVKEEEVVLWLSFCNNMNINIDYNNLCLSCFNLKFSYIQV